MEENTKRRQSVYEAAEQFKEKSTRRRSIFETPNEPCDEEKWQQHLEKWDKRWGKYGTNYVDVVKYPENYVRKIKGEIEMWQTGAKDIIKKNDEFWRDTEENDLVLDGCKMPTDQIVTLQDIDCRIKEFIDNSKSILQTTEVFTRLQQMKAEHVKREIRLTERLINFEMSQAKHGPRE